jgi:hypothetical protein
MAKVLDEVLESTVEGDSFDDAEAVNPAKTEEVKSEPNPENDLPEKYKGKSVKDIVAMHQEAEKLIGKQGSEVGELRRVVDDFIKAQTSKDLKTNIESEISEEDFFVDPKTSISKAIDNHPSIQQAKLAARELKRVETLNKLQAEHPNVGEIVQDANFVDWIKSSRVRTELFVRAENDFDFDAANELLSTWKEKQEISKKATETSKVDREKQLKAADVATTNATESVPKKKYRRSDIIKLMQTDPDRYDALSQEIMKAYEEGRVI